MILNFLCGNKMPTICNRSFYCRSYCNKICNKNLCCI